MMDLRRIRTLALALALVPVLRGQEGELAERLFRSGERAYAAKAYPEALETWNQLLQQAPRSDFAAQALLALARHQLEVARRPDAALPLLERIKAEHLRSPWAADAMLLRGGILAARAHGPQELREALAEYNRVVDLFPGHPLQQQTRVQMGDACRQLGQWGRALENYVQAIRLDPATDLARDAQLQAAGTLDLMDDLTGCLRMLQDLRNQAPQSTQAAQAEWRIRGLVKQRLQKPPPRSLGPWPEGRQKWLKTPTLLATGPDGELALYQDGLDQAFRLKAGQLVPAGAPVKGARAMVVTGAGQVWLVNGRQGVVKEDAPAPAGPPALQSPTGAALDGWGNLWVSDAKAPAIQVTPPEGAPWQVPAPGVTALAPLADGGVAAAADGNRTLLFLDAQGRPRLTLPYGKDLPAPFRSVLALAADPLGHLAALVEGEFEGIVVWGPDGSVLRSATFKALGLNGRFRALAFDRQGCLILADRSNDLLIRID